MVYPVTLEVLCQVSTATILPRGAGCSFAVLCHIVTLFFVVNSSYLSEIDVLLVLRTTQHAWGHEICVQSFWLEKSGGKRDHLKDLVVDG